MPRRLLLALSAAALLAACAATPPGAADAPPAPAPVDRANLPFSSAECLAAQLPPGPPFPASAIPPAALAARQSGLVAIRYDVIGGSARNLEVVQSSPPGVYDAAALAHAGRYRAPAARNVRGCVTIIDVRF